MPGFVGCNCKCSPEPLPINNASYVPFHHLWCAWWDTNGRRTRSGRCRTWICRRHIWLAGNLAGCSGWRSSWLQVQGTPSLDELLEVWWLTETSPSGISTWEEGLNPDANVAGVTKSGRKTTFPDFSRCNTTQFWQIKKSSHQCGIRKTEQNHKENVRT